MIKIKFLGGAKKSFLTDQLEINQDNITINDLIDYLLRIKPTDTHHFDVNNLLIAINGVDSSALDGKMTKIKPDDIVSIVPIIHGGSPNRIQLKIKNNFFDVYEIHNDKNFDDSFLTKLRINHPNVKFQGISSRFILNLSHIRKILTISIEAKKRNTLLSDKIETDILLRFANTTQIADAIKKIGINKKYDFFIMATGKKKHLNDIYAELGPLLKPQMFRKNDSILRKEFKISNVHTKAVMSDSPLEDILVEKAAVLF